MNNDMNNNMNNEIDTYKILIIGSSACGKSSIVNRFCYGTFKNNEPITAGIDFKIKSIYIDGEPIKLNLIDTSGDPTYKPLIEQCYKDIDGIVIVFDVSNESSFNIAKKHICDNKDEAALVLVGNKVDLINENDYNYDHNHNKINEFILENKIKYIQSSAKTNKNIKEIFTEIVNQIVQSENSFIEEINSNNPENELIIEKQIKRKQTCFCNLV